MLSGGRSQQVGGAIGDIQRAVVTVDGKEIPSQLDDINRDCTNVNSGSLPIWSREKPRPIRCTSIVRGEQAQYPAHYLCRTLST